MGIGARPKTEHHTLLVPLFDVVDERDVEFSLNLRILFSVPLGESKQRLVAGVVRKRFRHLVIRGQIDAQPAESFDELDAIAVEQVSETRALWISAPLQKQVEQLPTPGPKREIQRGVGLEVGVVAVTQEEQNQSVVPGVECDLERRGDALPLNGRPGSDLERATRPNPALDVVETTVATEAMEFCESFGICGCPRSWSGCRRNRIGSWVNKRG